MATHNLEHELMRLHKQWLDMKAQRDELLTELKEVRLYATSRGYFSPKSADEAIEKAEQS